MGAQLSPVSNGWSHLWDHRAVGFGFLFSPFGLNSCAQKSAGKWVEKSRKSQGNYGWKNCGGVSGRARQRALLDWASCLLRNVSRNCPTPRLFSLGKAKIWAVSTLVRPAGGSDSEAAVWFVLSAVGPWPLTLTEFSVWQTKSWDCPVKVSRTPGCSFNLQGWEVP